MLDGRLATDTPTVLNAWTEHFSTLAVPVESQGDDDYDQLVMEDLLVIKQICLTATKIGNFVPFTVAEVVAAVNKLNNGAPLNP